MSENQDYNKLMKRYQKMFELARDHMNSCYSFRNKVIKERLLELSLKTIGEIPQLKEPDYEQKSWFVRKMERRFT